MDAAALRPRPRLLLAVAAIGALVVLAPLRSAHAVASGPNGPIAYVDGSNHIAVVDPDGSDQHTDAAVTGKSPTWSPAHDKIAFVDTSVSPNQVAVMTYDASNGNFGAPTDLAGTDDAEGVAWSPDGTELAWSDGAQIATVAPDGTGYDQLTTGSVSMPAWSPNGSKLAFVSNGEIWVMNSDGSDQKPLTDTGHADSFPSWSPDGSTIVFDSNRNGANHQIYEVPAAGPFGDITRLTNDLAVVDSSPIWAPNGSSIVFTHGGTLTTMDADGSDITAVSGSIAGSDPDWALALGVLTPPAISPTSNLSSGTQLTASTGTWNSTSTPVFGYQWQRCNSAGSACVSIGGATAQKYTLTAADGGSTIRVVVTATASGGSSSATSAQVPSSGVVGSAGPTNTTLPVILVSGVAPLQGTAISATVGSWAGSPPITYSYEWLRCDGSGNCVFTGTTSSTYTPTASDIGSSLRVRVTATNAAGSTSATSNATQTVRGLAPAPVTPPSLSTFTPVVGQTIVGTVGAWSGQLPITFKYVFEKCNADGSLCIPLPTPAPDKGPLPTSASIFLGRDLAGWRIAFHVYASNAIGEVNARSELSKPVVANTPVASVRPVISGINAVGQQLQTTTGTWTSTGGTIAYAYAWQRCDTLGENCKPIPGATASTYLLTTADLGATIRVDVTASNSNGSATAQSDHTYPTKPRLKLKPSVTTVPTIIGTPDVGTELRISDGVWGGDQPMTFKYHWRRCDATGAHCKVQKTTQRTYLVTTADLGHTLRVVVTAKNANGATSAISDATDTVQLVKRPRSRHIVGSSGPNYLAGGGGDDTILGGRGNDTILGGAGDDLLDGGPGDDVITGGPGHDRILGGPGSDTIIANDGEQDVIDCGPGRDRAIVDANDVVANCEVVQTVAPPTTPPTTTTPGG